MESGHRIDGDAEVRQRRQDACKETDGGKRRVEPEVQAPAREARLEPGALRDIELDDVCGAPVLLDGGDADYFVEGRGAGCE